MVSMAREFYFKNPAPLGAAQAKCRPVEKGGVCEVYVRAKLPISWLGGLIHRCSVSLSNKSLSLSLSLLDLDGGDSGGDREVSITHDGHEAILNEVVGPGLIAVNTCVDMMCVSIIRATTGALPIVGDESQHGRQRHPQE